VENTLRRGPLLITALLAAVGGAAIYLVAQAATWRLSWPYGLLFAGLGVAQLATAAAVLARPTRRRILAAATAALAVIALWALVRPAGALPAPDPWSPVDSVIGFTDTLCAVLQAIAAAALLAMAAAGPRPRGSLPRRVFTTLGLVPVMVVVLLGVVVGVAASSNGFAGTASTTMSPKNLPAGRMSTVEYCRPDGIPLAMDLFMPPAAARAAPVAMYVHGGGYQGNRQRTGLGATLANHEGALFTPLQRQLNARGFVVASIDYRLPPATPWPASIVDVTCAVRFLRAHAADLGIDPARIGVWGSSGGGQLVSILGLARPAASFDRGQYPGQSSAVQAVVDMFGGADFTDVRDSSPFARFVFQLTYGSSPATRRSASPITYVAPGAPPFLILQGSEDPAIRPRQSAALAQRLQSAGVPVHLIEVRGTGHTMSTVGQQPSPDRLTSTIIDFFTTTLR
jgi:acetyl esterase/lipase